MAELRAGDRVGPYELLSPLGEGGYGSVWLAERREPYAQRVALKFVKQGTYAGSFAARFDRERQTLALMSHPGIARVLDGGAAPDGRPFLAMDFVDGRSITAWCAAEAVPLRERVALIAQVCDAVQHAHSKGVLHRDLKPSNILALRDGDGRAVARVIDFGIARILGDEGARGHTMTEAGQLLGTPEYMSPEQADPDGPDLDTRSDVYALGAVLYELVVGAPPFGGSDSGTLSRAQVLRSVRRDPVPAPSARARESVPRELDWILLKALRKDPDGRYDSAAALGRDLRRFLAGDAIEAAPESAAYRFRAYARRNRTQVAAAGAVLAVLVAATAVSGWLALRERDARADADARAAEAKRIASFQARLLDGIDPAFVGAWAIGDIYRRGDASIKARYTDADELKQQRLSFYRPIKAMDKSGVGAEVITKSLLEPMEQGIARDFADLPLVAAELRTALAGRFSMLGNFEKAQQHIDEALRVRREMLGPDHPDVAASLAFAGTIASGRGDPAAAEAACLEALRIRRLALGPDAVETIEVEKQVGGLVQARGDAARAAAILGDAYRRAVARFGEDDTRFFGLRREYAAALAESGEAAEAERLARSAMEAFAEVVGENGAGSVRSQLTLGYAIAQQGRLEEAEKVLADVVERTTRVYGAEDSDTLHARAVLARVRMRRDASAVAVDELAQLHALLVARFGAAHPESAWAARELASRQQADERPNSAP
ncbi:MAG: Serine/threonine-protein kinase PknB [Planctomycetota bacterium]